MVVVWLVRFCSQNVSLYLSHTPRRFLPLCHRFRRRPDPLAHVHGNGLRLLPVRFAVLLFCMKNQTDSAHSIKCFADLGERCIGRPFRHVCNIIQSIQLILNVALLLEGNAVTMATITNYKVCYIVWAIVWLVVGAGGGQIRSLRNFSIFANLNIFLNVVVILMTIIGCAIYAPIPTLNFPDLPSGSTPGNGAPAVFHYAFSNGAGGPAGDTPGLNNWYVQVGGVIYAVFAYGGAMIFVEFMAEMRRPRDFWKAGGYPLLSHSIFLAPD